MGEFFKTIKKQSVVIVIAFLGYSYFSLEEQASTYSFLSISGALSFLAGLFIGLGSFFVNQLGEKYENMIDEYAKLIKVLQSQNKFTENHLKKLYSPTTANHKPNYGGYIPKESPFETTGDESGT